MTEEELIVQEDKTSGDGASASAHTRRLSLEKDFMNRTSDDLIYGLMLCFATYNPNDKELYLSKKNFIKNRRIFYELCDLGKFSNQYARKLKYRVDNMLDTGLIAEDDNNYYFPYDVNGKYRIVDKDMLRYIIDTRSKFAVKVYIILADWFSWKSLMKEKYYFSRSELAESLGYSKDNSEFRTTIDHVLESLNREGIIQYIPVNVKRITDTGREIIVPLLRLDFVARHKSELKK